MLCDNDGSSVSLRRQRVPRSGTDGARLWQICAEPQQRGNKIDKNGWAANIAQLELSRRYLGGGFSGRAARIMRQRGRLRRKDVEGSFPVRRRRRH